MGIKKRLTKTEFLKALKENAGLFSQTARWIEKKYKISYSRQAVEDRAKTFPEELKQIEEANLDIAEHEAINMLTHTDPATKAKMVQFYLKTKGKARGYVEKSEMDLTSKGEKIGQFITTDLDGKPCTD